MIQSNKLKQIGIAENNLFLIAGPCVIEDEKDCEELALRLKSICEKININFIFKASFDKANRSSVSSYRGPGIEKGLDILNNIRSKLNIAVTSDIHCVSQLEKAKHVLDIIQIPAFLCRQTDLLVESGKTNRIVNVKKGQFMAPWDMKNVVDKVCSTGNDNIVLTERGYSFGYNNLVSDMRSIIIMKDFGFPVVFDATHSVQLPGGAGTKSDGNGEYAGGLALSACAVGCDGLFFETHLNPEKALCDGANMLALGELEEVLRKAKMIRVHAFTKARIHEST